MDWMRIYIEEEQKDLRRTLGDIIKARILRFMSNEPVTADQFAELEYLILYHDERVLWKKYGATLPEATKARWLDINLRIRRYHSVDEVQMPFYLMNPETTDPRIDKSFLHDQLL